MPRACAALPRSVQPRPPIVRLETRLRVKRWPPHEHAGEARGLRMRARPARQHQLPALCLPPRPPPVAAGAARRAAAPKRGQARRHRGRPARAAQREAPGARLDALAPQCGGHGLRAATQGRLFGGEDRSVATRWPVNERAFAPPRATLGPGPVVRVQTVTTADLARASSSRRCARVRRAAAPPVTG